ncbi:MAG: radical SAM protein [Aeromicrobium sp.]
MTVLDDRGSQMEDLSRDELNFVWLEITGRCNLTCVHCYAESGPTGTHGSVATERWLELIDEAAVMGTMLIQLIGGEPTLHPDFTRLLHRVLANGMEVEVYSNLFQISERVWKVLQAPGVRLATSFYSADEERHDRVTGRAGSQQRTLVNIEKAVALGIPIRVGIINMDTESSGEQAADTLRALGVDAVSIDNRRDVGRGAAPDADLTLTDPCDELCGACTSGSVAILPDGTVQPCVFSRWLPVGNVLESPLCDVVRGSLMRETTRVLDESFAKRIQLSEDPDVTCPPLSTVCPPKTNPPCQPSSGPCMPTSCNPNCEPSLYCVPRQSPPL